MLKERRVGRGYLKLLEVGELEENLREGHEVVGGDLAG